MSVRNDADLNAVDGDEQHSDLDDELQAVSHSSALPPSMRIGPKDPHLADPPFHWPTARPGEAAARWEGLRHYADGLRARYEVFRDPRTLPGCWYRHPSFVSALQALKDYERVAYSDEAPGNAGVDFLRALREMAGLMRSWVEEPKFACGAKGGDGGHEAPTVVTTEEKEFAKHVAEDVRVRRETLIESVQAFIHEGEGEQ